MSDYQNGVEISKQVIDLSGKVAFMLITASTASIGYILTQIKNEIWSIHIYFALCAIILLAVSFISGYKYLDTRIGTMHLNSILLQTSNDKNLKDERLKLSSDFEKALPKLRQYATIQFFTFISGALVYGIYVFLGIFNKIN
ncbi:hypothetical protein [uncultured Acinetobacter sp.]|uniref:hypothetical protein n=1 Tax=uncultured Acinetobacter sp. TaxID=165433 RepID=UPI002590CEE2|nr:hypothetical protein [uncultured Acinetobacter sp.]